MDFSNFKTIEKKNSVATSDLSVSLEGQEKIIPVQAGYHLFKQIFQSCSKCGKGMIHAIIRNKVKCLGCESEYILD